MSYLPPDPRVQGQADMVAAALADYAYDWITLTIETVDGDLVIRSSFAGRPAKPIPFAHDLAKGTFVRVAEGKAAGFQGPMQIDLKFRVPLNQLLGYGFGTAAGIRAMNRNP